MEFFAREASSSIFLHMLHVYLEYVQCVNAGHKYIRRKKSGNYKVAPPANY